MEGFGTLGIIEANGGKIHHTTYCINTEMFFVVLKSTASNAVSSWSSCCDWTTVHAGCRSTISSFVSKRNWATSAFTKPKWHARKYENVSRCTLPETNSSPLKMDGWNTTILLGRLIFRGYGSFREGITNPLDIQTIEPANISWVPGFQTHTEPHQVWQDDFGCSGILRSPPIQSMGRTVYLPTGAFVCPRDAMHPKLLNHSPTVLTHFLGF